MKTTTNTVTHNNDPEGPAFVALTLLLAVVVAIPVAILFSPVILWKNAFSKP